MQPIVPKGYDINQFPPALSPAQIAIVDEIKAGSSKTDTIGRYQTLVLEILNKHKAFFIPHFGTNMLAGIMETYFPSGHSVKEGGGAGNSLGIAQEIMAYKNPAPEQGGVTLGVVIALLNAILQMPKIESGTSSSQIPIHNNIKDAVFELSVRPTRDAIVALKSVPSGAKKSTGEVLLIGNTKPSEYINTNLFNSTKYHYTRPVGNLLKAFMWQKSHSDKFLVLPTGVLQYYEKAYKGTAKDFWSFHSKHRLGVEVDAAFGKENYVVKVFSVDPVTGAPTSTGRYAVGLAPISDYQGNSGFLLSKVKKSLFPEMYLLSEGVVAGTNQRQDYYKDQLLNAKNMFEGIPDKAKTPIATIVEQSYSYSYQQGVAPPAAPGSTTTKPVNGLRIYLQPTGIEEAMKRILDISHTKGNAIEKWFVNDLTRARQGAETGTKYKYTVSADTNQWAAINKRYTNTVKVVYALMDNPNLLSEGLNGKTLMTTMNSPSYTLHKMAMWGQGHWLVNEPTARYSQSMTDALKIFRYAGWPEAEPQEIFSAPVDDHQDVSMIIGMFNKYMNENTLIGPGQIFTPESFNGTLSSKQYVAPSTAQGTGQGGIAENMFTFDKRYSILYSKNLIINRVGNLKTTRLQTYSSGSRTVVSKQTTRGSIILSMPKITASYSTKMGMGNQSQPLSDIQGAGIVGAGALALTAGVLGYMFLKR